MHIWWSMTKWQCSNRWAWDSDHQRSFCRLAQPLFPVCVYTFNVQALLTPNLAPHIPLLYNALWTSLCVLCVAPHQTPIVLKALVFFRTLKVPRSLTWITCRALISLLMGQTAIRLSTTSKNLWIPAKSFWSPNFLPCLFQSFILTHISSLTAFLPSSSQWSYPHVPKTLKPGSYLMVILLDKYILKVY